MAGEENTVEKKTKSKLSLIMIIGLIVLGIILAGVISFFVAARIAGDRNVTVITKREPGILYVVGSEKDGVVVNIGGITGRYLKIDITLEVEPTKDAAGKLEISQQDGAKMKDSVIKLLRSQKLDAFTPDKQDVLKDEVKKTVNSALGSERVYNVYITNVVVQ